MSMQDSFLMDEVRCGFMIPAAVKQAWAAELEVITEIDRVCKKHNIQYFADWGTLLGAVRHGGFIPWDDDLDIVMKREDYIKFMTVARFDMEEGFDVRTFRNHEDCWLFMGKVVGRNGFCFEKDHLRRFHNFHYIASVDIFVLDYVHRDPKKEEKRRELCKYMLAVADSIVKEHQTPEEREYRLKIVEEMYGKKISRLENSVEMRRYLYGEVEKIFAEVLEQEADKLTQIFPRGLRGDAFQFPKEYYEHPIYLPFECISMPVPMAYDKMLRQRYGDYARFVKTAGGHNYPFFEGQKKNLQKALDFELPEFRLERTKLFRNKEEESCKNLSYKVMAKECTCELWKMKEQLSQAIEQIQVEPAYIERVMDLLQNSQQLAIDFGNMLEPFLGEDCAVMRLLERYCETLYIIYEHILADVDVSEVTIVCDRLCDVQKAITDELEQSIFGRRAILFLPVLVKDWCSLHSLWQEYVKDGLCDVYVVPLPYYYKDYDSSPRKVCCDVAQFPEELRVLDYKVLTPEHMEMLHPEIIIIQNPYDSWNSAISVPDMFYSENIRKYTDELIYVPPFTLDEYSKSNEREYSNMKYYVTMPGVVYADRVVVQSENMRQVYIEKLTEFAGEETQNVWEQRVSMRTLSAVEQNAKVSDRKNRRENEENNSKKQVHKKKMLYGISYGAYISDVEAAQRKIERNLQHFEECKGQIDITIQIFPDSMDADEVRNYISRILENYSGKMVKNGAKSCAKDYDAYYGDVMPLVMEFRDAGKPVMIQDIYVE